jgi:WD40 repeat protein
LPTEFKYWAFLSYSHQDNLETRHDGTKGHVRWAEWLHDSLETYKVPAEFRSRQARTGEAMPERFYPAFQDEKELPINADLGQSIRTALRESRFLIVICSPRSATSRYVNEEVRYFKELGRGDRIMTLMIDGEPNVSFGNKAGFSTTEECFCPALRHPLNDQKEVDVTRTDAQEPIAGDVRIKDSASTREATRGDLHAHRPVLEYMKLKLLAGLMGAGFDELAQRDKERQLKEERGKARRLRKLAAGFAALALIAAVAGAIAFFKEREATRSRKETQSQLSRNYLVQGARAKEEGNPRLAAAFLARGLRVSPRNDAALVMLVMLLEQTSFPLPSAVMQYDQGVTFANWSRNGARFFTLTENTAQVWNALTGASITGVLKHEGEILGAELNPDGTKLLTICQDSLQIWRCDEGISRPSPIVVIDTKHLNAARLSPDGTRIATAFKDGTVRIWSSDSGASLGAPLKHSTSVVSIDWSPDSKQLATASNSSVQIWDIARGQVVSSRMFHDKQVNSVQFSCDGNRIVTASDDETARVWSVPSGEAVLQLRHKHELTSAQFSPDGTKIVTMQFVLAGPAAQASAWLAGMNGGGARCELWDVKTAKSIANVSNEFVINSVDFSPDSASLAVASTASLSAASQKGTVVVFSLKNLTPSTVPVEQGNSIASVRFNPEGTRLLTASFDGTARLYDVRNGRQCPMKLNDVTSGVFASEGEEVFVISGAHPALTLNARTGQPLPNKIKIDKPIVRAYLSFDEKRVATVFQDNTVQVWNRFGLPLTGLLPHKAEVTLAAFSPDSRRLLTVSDAPSYGSVNGTGGTVGYHAIHIWNENGMPAVAPIELESDIQDASWAKDGKRVLSVSGEDVRVWDAERGSLSVPPLTHEGEDGDPTVARFDPEGKRIAVGFGDYTAQVWDAQNGQPITEPLAHHKTLSDVRFSPDGTKLLAEVHDLGVARIWDPRTGHPLTPDLKGDDFVISAIGWRPNGKQIATNTDVWDAEVGTHLGPLYLEKADRLEANSLQWNLQGTRVLLSCTPYSQIVDISPSIPCPDWLPKLAEAVGGYRINEAELVELTPTFWKDIRDVGATLNVANTDNDWEIWGRWFLGDRSTRTISPFSKVTIPEYIENRIKENTAESLDGAEQLAVGNAELLQRIRKAREALKQKAESPKQP